MEDDAPIIYGLELQARALAAQIAETEAIRFLVGTQSLKFDNQVHLIEFDDENNTINKNVLLHREGEIWHISASPTEKNILSTCYNKTSDGKCDMQSAIWQIPVECESAIAGDDTSSFPSLECLCKLEVAKYGAEVKCVQWEPGSGNKVFSLVDNRILLWDLVQSGQEARLGAEWGLEKKGHNKFTTGKWNPHQSCNHICTASDTTILGWDIRSESQVYQISNAHGQLVRDLDFNPNKQYVLASCGDDCKTKFWDVRNTHEPLLCLADHSHWVWTVSFNHFHDQLVLTSSSDSRVILSSAASVSSEPFGHAVDEDDLEPNSDDEGSNRKASAVPMSDGVIQTYEEHEDSVYAVGWSSVDPWLFVSLSYDGRLVINRVPRAEKYRILL